MHATRSLFAVAALSLGGCSLVWTPVYPEDANVDAHEDPDAFVAIDAGVDAFVPPDAYVPPPEECGVIGDEDMDDFADCSDPDCYGHVACCDARDGDDAYDARFMGTTRPLEWSSRAVTLSAIGAATRIGATGVATGSLWRQLCVPLGQGGRFRFRLEGRSESGSGNTISIVLSPSAEPGPSGFLDELALHIGEENRLTATRAGSPVALSGTCVSEGSAELGTATTFELTLLPGVADESSALLATLTVTSDGGCTESTALFEDEAILVSDLRRTPLDASRSCQDSPGLWFALDVRGAGAFAVSPLGLGETEIEMRPLECASPGVFTRSSIVLDRESVQDGAATYTSGGIGAPDLTAVGAQWALAYDASLEDRSEEIFRPLTLSLGVARGAAADSSTFTPTSAGAVGGTGMRSREPSLSSSGGRTFLVWSREDPAMPGRYALFEGLFDLSTGMTTASPLIDPMLDTTCRSLREASSAPAFDSMGRNDGDWIFARCDEGADSTLAMWRRVGSDAPNVFESNVLEGDEIEDRVIAADVFAVRKGSIQTFGLWVLARGPADEAELHLYLADRVAGGAAPRFVAYAGNPILTEADGSLPACPTGDTCRLTSFSVAPVFHAGSPDDVRFLFARSRTGTTTTYEIVAAQQRALATLDE